MKKFIILLICANNLTHTGALSPAGVPLIISRKMWTLFLSAYHEAIMFPIQSQGPFVQLFREMNSADYNTYVTKHQDTALTLACLLNSKKPLITAWKDMQCSNTRLLDNRQEYMRNYMRTGHEELNKLEQEWAPQLNLKDTTREFNFHKMLRYLMRENQSAKLEIQESNQCGAAFLTRLALLQAAKNHDSHTFSLITNTDGNH